MTFLPKPPTREQFLFTSTWSERECQRAMTVLSTKPDEHSTIPGSDNENVRYYQIKAPFSHNEKPWVESRAQRNANSSYK